jgi:hypothetical protein
MKILIHSSEQPPIVTYFQEKTQVVHKDEVDFDTLKNQFYDEVICYDYLDYIDENDISSLIEKLAPQGKLTIKGVDLFETTRAFQEGLITTQELSSKINNRKLRCFCVNDLAELIQSKNLKVTFAGISGVNYMIEAKK